jgi:hypothetical protein
MSVGLLGRLRGRRLDSEDIEALVFEMVKGSDGC